MLDQYIRRSYFEPTDTAAHSAQPTPYIWHPTRPKHTPALCPTHQLFLSHIHVTLGSRGRRRALFISTLNPAIGLRRYCHHVSLDWHVLHLTHFFWKSFYLSFLGYRCGIIIICWYFVQLNLIDISQFNFNILRWSISQKLTVLDIKCETVKRWVWAPPAGAPITHLAPPVAPSGSFDKLFL